MQFYCSSVLLQHFYLIVAFSCNSRGSDCNWDASYVSFPSSGPVFYLELLNHCIVCDEFIELRRWEKILSTPTPSPPFTHPLPMPFSQLFAHYRQACLSARLHDKPGKWKGNACHAGFYDSIIHKLSYRIHLTRVFTYNNPDEWITFRFRMSARQVASREEFYTYTSLPLQE